MFFDKTSQQVVKSPVEDFFSEVDRQRIESYKTFLRFYLGKHYPYEREPGDEPLVVNYCRAFIDKKINFTWGKGFEVILPENNTEIIKPVLDTFWEFNNKNLWGIHCATMGYVTGDVFIKIKDLVNEDFEVDEYYKDTFKAIILDSAFCFPIYEPFNRNVLKKFIITYKYYDNATSGSFGASSPANKNFSGNNNTSKEKRYYEEITPEKIIINDDGVIQEFPNIYGFIPIIHIRNNEMPNLLYGISDLNDFIRLNKEFNDKLTNISDIIDYHEAPVTIIFGAKASSLEKGSNKVWSGLPSDARVENLSLNADLSASVNFLDKLKTSMHELMSVPEATLGKQQQISNTSGVALQIQYQPLTEDRDRKVLIYGTALRKLNAMVLKMYEIKYKGDKDYFKKLGLEKPYKNNVVFVNTLPKDRNVVLSEIVQRMSSAYPLISIRKAISMLGEDPDELIPEIEKDLTKLRGTFMPEGAFEQSNESVMKKSNLRYKPESNETIKDVTEGSFLDEVL